MKVKEKAAFFSNNGKHVNAARRGIASTNPPAACFYFCCVEGEFFPGLTISS